MKKNDGLKVLERICVVGIVVLLAVIAIGVWMLYEMNSQDTEDQADITEPTAESAVEGQEGGESVDSLTQPSDFLPQNLQYGKKLPVTVFETAEAQPVDLKKEYPGETLVLMYWGTWCPYCEKQLTHLAEFEELLKTKEATRIVLINKTDPRKEESVEKAAAYLAENHFYQDCLYDVDLKAYQAYGVKRIPTTIVVDPDGYVRAMEASVIDSAEKLDALLDYAQQGSAASLLAFLNNSMRNEEGGVYTNCLKGAGGHPSGHDVLSESMGLLMEYAVTAGDRELFDSAYSFVKNYMQKDGLVAWYVTENGEKAGANAFLDDLRIAGALQKAQTRWGGYEEYAQLAANIQKRNLYRKQIASFYDFNVKEAGRSISLCYADFSTMDKLAEAVGGLSEYSEALRTIVENGYIGDAFPLYYSSWDYQKNRYSNSSIHTAEGLMTLCHLAEAGMLKESSLEWLRERLLEDNLAARYEVDGSVPAGYAYDSTAVYAIAAMIGAEAGDAQIYMLAISKMERSRVTDQNSPFYGGFSNDRSGKDITAFDQLMPLLVYAQFGTVKFE